jgi:glycosyltransferase involved in cell wall biosynthesis
MSVRSDGPRLSIITPVHEPPAELIAAAIASVSAQTVANWELCLVDDASRSAAVRDVLEDAARRDERVVLHQREEAGGISIATNDALAVAKGEYVAFLDHVDELHATALASVTHALDAFDDVDYLYTDEDKIDLEGRHYDPFCKPDWSPDRLRVQLYTGHLSVVRRSLVQELGGLDARYDGAQDWDLALRITERARRVVHVPEILYHRRAVPTSVAVGDAVTRPDADAARRAIGAHLERTRVQGVAEPINGHHDAFRIRPALRETPTVSIVMPTAGSRRVVDGVATDLVVHSIDSIVRRSTYSQFEIVVVLDVNVSRTTRALIDDVGRGRVRMVPYDQPFNFSEKINIGVAHSVGEHLLFLNDDVELLPDGWRPGAEREGCSAWLEQMLVYSMQPDIGAVGARLYFPDGRLQHAGIVSVFGSATHALYLMDGTTSGYHGAAGLVSNYLAVTGACLMTRRDAFDLVGGLDERLPVNYNDLAYCLALRDAHLRSVYVPDVQLLHFESATRTPGDVDDFEKAFVLDRWYDVVTRDPYYPAAFLPGRSDFALPPYRADGSFGHRAGALSAVLRARELMAEGGIGLLTERAYGKIRRIRRP